MSSKKEDRDDEALRELVKQNIKFLYGTLGGSTKGFAARLSVSDDTVSRLLKNGTTDFNSTMPIEEAFQLRSNALRLPHDEFVRHFNTRFSEAPALRPPQAIIESWSKTIAFAEKLRSMEPLYLYYWSREDKAVIANRCDVKFSTDAGIEFSFFNPLHEGPSSLKKTGELRFSGPLRLINELISFEVYSDEPTPEPASGLATPGTSTVRAVALGKMVGLQTRIRGEKYITDFKFIILSNPDKEKLQKTDRISPDGIPEPLASYFKEELG